MNRARPRSQAAAWTIAPVLAGAVAASSAALLLGWPQRPPPPGLAGDLAAAAVVLVAVLVVFQPTIRPRRRVTDLVRARRADIDPVHARARVVRELVRRPGVRSRP